MKFRSGFDGQGRPFPIPTSAPSPDFSADSAPWWHTIPLADGSYTKGAKSIEMMRNEAALYFDGVDLTGRSFIDVGAWNGGFTVEAASRGANRLAALDRYHLPELEHHFQALSSISYVIERTGLDISLFAVNLDNPRLDLTNLGTFDVVLFAGVFYHLVNPLSALREVAAMATETLVVETWIDNTNDDRPGMIFYPGAEVNNDSSNWWGPNIPFMVEFLKLLGFAEVEVLRNEMDPNRGIFRARRPLEAAGKKGTVIDFAFDR